MAIVIEGYSKSNCKIMDMFVSMGRLNLTHLHAQLYQSCEFVTCSKKTRLGRWLGAGFGKNMHSRTISLSWSLEGTTLPHWARTTLSCPTQSLHISHSSFIAGVDEYLELDDSTGTWRSDTLPSDRGRCRISKKHNRQIPPAEGQGKSRVGITNTILFPLMRC